jgi:hypothetical protein
MPESPFAAVVDGFRSEARVALAPRSALEAEGPAPDPADLLSRSQEIEDTAARSLDSGDGDVRELAAMQLAAGAALDLAAAADLLEPPSRPAFEAQGPAVMQVEQVAAELQAILEAPPALGARASAPEIETSPLEAGAEPLPALEAAARKSIDEISGDAGRIAGHAIGGLVALPTDALIGAFADAADKLLGPVYHQVTGAARWAMRHVGKAISKLLRVLGPLEGPARKWLEKAIGGLTRDKLTAWAVDKALGVDRVSDEVKSLVAGATPPGDAARLRAAGTELGSLASRFGRHELVIRVLAKILGKLRAVILGLVGWAAAALAGVYVLMLSYGIWMAGDYLDWLRTAEQGRLDFVGGVRTTVRLAVTA